MSTPKLTDIQLKAMRLRAAVLHKIKARGTISQFDLDVLELLESRDDLEDQVATYKELIENDRKFEITVSSDDPDRVLFQLGDLSASLTNEHLGMGALSHGPMTPEQEQERQKLIDEFDKHTSPDGSDRPASEIKDK